MWVFIVFCLFSSSPIIIYFLAQIVSVCATGPASFGLLCSLHKPHHLPDTAGSPKLIWYLCCPRAETTRPTSSYWGCSFETRTGLRGVPVVPAAHGLQATRQTELGTQALALRGAPSTRIYASASARHSAPWSREFTGTGGLAPFSAAVACFSNRKKPPCDSREWFQSSPPAPP